MIPYFQINSIILGPITIQFWGLMVSLGILSAVVLTYFLSKKYLLVSSFILDLAVWILVGGLIGARVFHILFYSFSHYLHNPLKIFFLWEGGASSLGGFVGAFLVTWIFAIKIRKFSFKELLPYLDVSVLSLWLGWGIGRIGCFFIHDHPGKLTDFFLAVDFPDGARFDLGLLDSILAFILFIIFACSFKKLVKIRYGLVATLSFLSYAIVRFFLDFLRVGDTTYLYFTPAQWGMIILAIILSWSLFKKKRY